MSGSLWGEGAGFPEREPEPWDSQPLKQSKLSFKLTATRSQAGGGLQILTVVMEHSFCLFLPLNFFN